MPVMLGPGQEPMPRALRSALPTSPQPSTGCRCPERQVPAFHASGGGSMQGHTWNLSGNTEYGLRVDMAEVIVDGLLLDSNGFAGAFVEDGRSVELSNLTASNNGQSGILPGQQAGLHYLRSNDVESNSGDVRCSSCEVRGNAGSALFIEDSVDLWVEGLLVEDVAAGQVPIFVDNSNLNTGQLGGRFRFMNVTVWANASDGTGAALPAIDVQSADGAFEGLDLHGVHAGVRWNADLPGQRVSYLHAPRLTTRVVWTSAIRSCSVWIGST